MGEGPATFRARYREIMASRRCRCATVLGVGLAVGTTMTGANAAPHARAGQAGSSVLRGEEPRRPSRTAAVIFQEHIDRHSRHLPARR